MMRTDWLLLRPTQEELEGLRRFLGNKAVDALLDDILEESLQYVEGLAKANGEASRILRTPKRLRPQLSFWSERAHRIRAAKNAVGVAAWDIVVNLKAREKVKEARRNV